MPLSSGLILAVIGTAAWYWLPPLLLCALLVLMLPAYAATWLVPMLQSGGKDHDVASSTAPRPPSG